VVDDPDRNKAIKAAQWALEKHGNDASAAAAELNKKNVPTIRGVVGRWTPGRVVYTAGRPMDESTRRRRRDGEVKKTSVYLSEREVSRLAWLAEQEGVSQADVVRRAISAYEPEAGDRDFRLLGSGTGPGGSVADIPEEELLVGFGE
jgi:hypothetical protein